ncbi:MAG: hypothetical protein LBU32_28775 [Clostridiales bacterium]|jgi:hypothetical protein|nr:hypothetical protein [Clostridiales bacterium]
MEQWEYGETHGGAPQGSGISPILSNIYPGRLDRFMEDCKGGFGCGRCRKAGPGCHRLASKAGARRIQLEKGKDASSKTEQAAILPEIKAMQAEAGKPPSKTPFDENCKRVQCVRCADDFPRGAAGSKKDAELVEAGARDFLAEKLKLKLSGCGAAVSRSQSLKKRKGGAVQRTREYTAGLLAPREKRASKQ